MNFNLLDLDNDILNIIGYYVKQNNIERMERIYKKFEKLYVKLDQREEERLLITYDKTKSKKYIQNTIDNIGHLKFLERLIFKKHSHYVIDCKLFLYLKKPFIRVVLFKDGEYKYLKYY